MANSNIFTRHDYDQLKAAQRRLHDFLELADKAESCGIDCQQMRDLHAQLSRSLEAFERHFFDPVPLR